MNRDHASLGAGRSKKLKPALMTSACLFVLALTAPGYAQAVGDTITNPVTGATETVEQVVSYGVITEEGNFILTSVAVGDTLPDPANENNTVTITAVTTNATTGLVESVTYKDSSNADQSLDVVQAVTSGTPGTAGGSISLNTAAGDLNIYTNIQRGNGGSNGRTGALFVSAGDGKDGATGPTVNATVSSGQGGVQTVSNNLPGVIAASIGGNGGKGGDSYFGGGGGDGGDGGAGGTVNLVSNAATITTSGDGSHGVVAQSRSGVGGVGGGGIGWSPGGGGGGGNSGGSATATSYSTIQTTGTGAMGVFAQSLGGGAGSGGSSYGLFGSGGDGNRGGDGGSAEAINYGSVLTTGNSSHGVSAQSVGGIGGDSGNAAGLLSFSSSGNPGGNGGSATVRLQTGGTVETRGDAAYGLFAQSLGGGGGNGGVSAGLVAIGATGGSGGNGGSASIYTQSGTSVLTSGASSYGIFAQSLGGGGGNGGVSGGLVAVGRAGDIGGTGGNVIIESGSVVTTSGSDAHGIFAQSIGGGGGNALGTGGLVAVGGSGSGAGDAGTVTVSTLTSSAITTGGEGAHGILAQSIGGGGGNGSATGGVVAIGGGAGDGGDAAAVSVTNRGTINTTGVDARGIFAQSLGGGGGNGGDSGGLVTIGGTGGGASTGGTVTVTNEGAISTTQNKSTAIQAQSLGGGGGDGGTTGGVFLTIGGSGGDGGASSLVTVNNSNDLSTEGHDAHGLFAQSVGGGGGNGGSTVSVSAFAGVAVGGSGGDGGDGAAVDINFSERTETIGGISQTISPYIHTQGDRARGVFAQSAGGGGGNGGFAVQVTGGYGVGVSVAVGGSGGGGGAGDTVTLDGDVRILTEGDNSEGIFAQSVGGGGGAGGFAVSFAGAAAVSGSNALAVGVGGSGGSGGAGGEVRLNSGGNIFTKGLFSTGLVAQSVGGGGGKGGFSVSIAGVLSGGVSRSLAVGVGGSGGSGGDGGLVNSVFNGDITTQGDDAEGALIQSVGGGGGAGGFNLSGALAFAKGGAGAASIGVGGSGGGASNGGTVTGAIGGTVDTTGDRADGVVIQSVGGGGGAGGFNVSGAIGGGGAFGGALAIGVGGSGGSGGNGGAVTASAQDITTRGDQSDGFVAQSTGGGGGNGGINVSGTISGTLSGGSVGVAIGVGGAGGSGGDASTVNATVDGNVTTHGADSDGIVAQSMGGGGGNGGLNVSGNISFSKVGSGAIGVGVGGAGGDGGNASGVTLNVTGTTQTGADGSGDGSDGIIAQSVGGGGGNGGLNVTGNLVLSKATAGSIGVGVGGSGGGGGNAGNVSATVNDGVADPTNTLVAVQTQGDNARGAVVQSVGGGGGNGGVSVAAGITLTGAAGGNIGVGVGGSGGSGGRAGTAHGAFTGDVITTGANSGGVLVQSAGGGGGSGGLNVTGLVRATAGSGGNIGVGVGGAGGSGGAGDAVTGSVTGDISTIGGNSGAMTYQSLGGGGGMGGLNVTGALDLGFDSGAIGGNLLVGVGGYGGDGGNASTVNASLTGNASTQGDQSHGVLIQSAGGGGGAGALNVSGGVSINGQGSGQLIIGVGGAGGDGGSASAVTGAVDGIVSTQGHRSDGVIIQSIGGGGGAGGLNISGGITGGSDFGGALTIGVGGSGGGGGSAGAVTASAKQITTLGDNSTGFLAQSAGGGGGAGAVNVSGNIQGSTNSGSASVGIAIGVGGSGGSGGDASTVNATVDGDVTTQGADSDGIVAQSMGGGGGNGGLNVTGNISFSQGFAGSVGVGVGGAGGDGGAASDVTLDVTGTTQTGADGSGDRSDGIIAQSVGGGGGNGGLNVTGSLNISTTNNAAGSIGVSVGGSGGGGGNAGNVSADVNNGVADPTNTLVAVQTQGESARGAVVQSVGGGGGNGGISIQAGVSLSSKATGNIGVGVGGSGGGGGNAGTAHGAFTGDVITTGANSGGVLVQSAAGGGGAGGFNITAGVSASKSTSGNIGIGVGGSGGNGGNASAVTGGVTGDISTVGDNSGAMTYQSVGGGGGDGAFNITGGVSLGFSDQSAAGNLLVGVGGSGGDGGDAGSATASLTGNVSTQGNQSHGILIQSAAGGGGNGGFNVTGGIAASGGTSGSIGVGVGGMGANAGHASTAQGTLSGNVTTLGNDAFGAVIQSVGGGGGNGGLNVIGNVSFTSSNSASVAAGVGVGGFGGGGGNADAVTGTVTGTYSTQGTNADGVIAQSLAGGGGNGGINISGSVALGTGTAGTVNVGIGGFGGDGGNASTVNLTRTGDTTTTGGNADGVVAQSIGGGGGNGGLNISGGLSATTKGSAGGFGFGLGGFGGAGGNAGAVTAAVTGNVHASGVVSDVTDAAAGTRTRTGGSNGILAQSVGGGGGNGGLNVTGNVAITLAGSTSGKSSRAASIGIGGFGGGAGNASTVNLTVASPDANRIQVQGNGDSRSAVAAQSLGGGGGVGGVNVSGSITMSGNLNVGIGGFGGSGGSADDVTASVDADLFAAGNYARGFMAQSVGGSGGHGGINIAGGFTSGTTGGSGDSQITFGMGGYGGSGNVSGDVTADHNGYILVEGANSVGLLAQSVAGGGGSGGMNVAANLNLRTAADGYKGKSYSVAVGIGGSGGDGGAHAGNVDVTSNGHIIVNGTPSSLPPTESDPFTAVSYGHTSNGIVAQSIGGGGGQGGMNIAGAVTRSGVPIAVGVGGSGGAGGDAGTVNLVRGYTQSGGTETETPALVRTFGADSTAILAQSVGGGGGNAGFNMTVSGTLAEGERAALISIGGSGDDAGDGDTVDVRHNGNVITDGANSAGIHAQSIGGGGGNANINFGFAPQYKTQSFNMALGGGTGDGGAAGAVSLDHDGTIVTAGDDSAALMAQSIGGGGGNTAANKISDLKYEIKPDTKLQLAIGREGGDGGESANVDVDFVGALDTAGDRSYGIFAQSIGGGGGKSSAVTVGLSTKTGGGKQNIGVSVGLEGGTGATAGNVTVAADDAANTITTGGDDAHGIYAQSVGGGGGVGGSASNSTSPKDISMTVAVGGTGGSGGTAGEVRVTSDSTIVTSGLASDGIFAQSVGGGGGAGGAANRTGLGYKPTTKSDTGNDLIFNVNVGGSGATGTEGNLASVTNTGTITTSGDRSNGVRAQSIGGGGGDGGMVLNRIFEFEVGSAGKPSKSQSLDVNVGGSGGTGGSGGQVNVINEGLITTSGLEAAGISASSIGGGGGNAGQILDISVSVGRTSATNTGRLVFNIGGSGGEGGTGGDVSVINRTVAGVANSGTIQTSGQNAYGIFAQSLGGGGGNGSSIISLTGTNTQESNVSFGFNLGGSGDTGGTGGSVDVNNSGLISTTGEGAHGIFAQSVGGGGGNGGIAIAANLAIGASIKNTPLIAIGGFGGDGGDGGAVTVTNTGTITTTGDNAHGILAQSVGGGGGNSSMGFALTSNPQTLVASNALSGILGATGGGSGGTGSGNVTVNQNGNITVTGRGSHAVKTESINGGGGSLVLSMEGISMDPNYIVGAFNPTPWKLPNFFKSGSAGLSTASAMAPAATEVLDTLPFMSTRAGGEDASAMAGADVSVTTSGTFGATGDVSTASFLQTIGGGGGSASLTASLSADPLDSNPINFELILGGVNGTDNPGGSVTNTHTGDLVTTGRLSNGLLAQSVGGGGGLGTVTLSAPDGAHLGRTTVSLGGTTGTNEAGGTISQTQTGVVSTTGAFSHGAVLQSIGGGGGAALIDIAAVDQTYTYIDASLGSDGGTGLDAGAITARFEGGIATSGDFSSGLVAQSIGAGGGLIQAQGSSRLQAAIGGQNGAEGSGADVDLVNTGTIATSGAYAHGVVVQSIGGGGGLVQSDASQSTSTTTSSTAGMGRQSVAPQAVSQTIYTASDANSGNGGNISFTQAGSIVTGGDGAMGIVAQSLAGGGGWIEGVYAGSAGGSGEAGTIDLNITGDILAYGEHGVGIFAQSLGADGAGDVTISVDGFVRGGTGLGAGLILDGGADNTVFATGSISALSGLSMAATTGNDVIYNAGFAAGNVDLGSGVNSYVNVRGATFLAFDTIDLRDEEVGQNPLGRDLGAVSSSALSTANGRTVELKPREQASSVEEPEVSGAGVSTTSAQPDTPTQEADTVPAMSNQDGDTLPLQPNTPNNKASVGGALSEPAQASLELEPNTPDRTSTVAGTPLGHQGESRVVYTAASAEVGSEAPVSSMTTSDVAMQTLTPQAATTQVFTPSVGPSPFTFTNDGTFLMGLSAPRFPLDLLKGDEFGNLDGMGDPLTNPYYGARVINTVLLDGHYLQTDGGHMVFDIAYGPYASDIVKVTGNTTVDGTGEVILTWLENDDPVTLFQTAGLATDNGLDIFDTLAVDYSIDANVEGIQLNIITNFGTDFLNTNGRALGGSMDSAIRAGDSAGIGRLSALLGNLRAGEEARYEYIMTELSPEPHLAPVHEQLAIANSLSQDLFNCQAQTPNPNDEQCVWARLETAVGDHERTEENFGVDSNSMSYRAGFERRLNTDWAVAVSLGYDDLQRIDVDHGRAITRGDAISGAIGFERRAGEGRLSAALSGGWSWYETDRVVRNIFTDASIANSEPELGYLRADFGASYRAELASLYATPKLDVSVTALHHNGLEETGLEGIGVLVDEDTQYIGAVHPQLELGWVFKDQPNNFGVMSVTLGQRYHSTDELDLPIRFIGANPGADPATIGTVLDESVFTVDAGVQISGDDRLGIRFGYEGEFSDNNERHRAGFDVRWRF